MGQLVKHTVIIRMHREGRIRLHGKTGKGLKKKQKKKKSDIWKSAPQ